MVFEPTPGSRPAFGSGPAFRPPSDFPAFGQPVLAPADARVVAARDGARDHRSRSTWAAFAYMMVEGSLRELGGAGRVLGNHVVLDLGGGVYAVLAHLRHGSVAVRPGEQVRRGQVIGHCGNTGNTSEPHLHFQLMDHPRPTVAAGLPFTFAGTELPANDGVAMLTATGSTGTADLRQSRAPAGGDAV
jgi:murein DD-endopeptidase MepM/ murein hydrolase activator NlpD